MATTRDGFHFPLAGRWRTSLAGVLLVALTLAAYLPALSAGFVWDDDLLVTANPLLRSLNGLRRIWFDSVTTDYTPLTFSAFWIEWHLWSANAVGYHVVNVLLHAGSALLLWWVLQELAIPGAWLAAVLFAVHPVNAASVAWIAEEKNTFSLPIYLLSIGWYLRYRGSNDRRFYGLALLAAACAFLSKGSTLILPVVLLLCTWWSEKKITRQDLLRTLPFFSLAGVMAWITVRFQYRIPETNEAGVPIAYRVARAGDAIWFYLRKDVWPRHLCAIYPRWSTQANSPSDYLPFFVAVLLILIFWSMRLRWGRGAFLAWSYFLVALLPVLGFLNMSFLAQAYVADWWQYLAIIGPLALIGASAARLISRSSGVQRYALCSATACIVIVLTCWTRDEARGYESMEVHCRRTLAENPGAWTAHDNLGNALQKQGRLGEAVAEHREAVRLQPEYALAHNNLGNALMATGNVAEATAEYREALRLIPDDPRFLNNLGLALQAQGEMDGAIRLYLQAMQVAPLFAEAHESLATALKKLGKLDDSIAEYQAALTLNPDYAEGHSNLGLALYAKGRIDDAITHYRIALRLKPDYAEACNNLGNALHAQGRSGDAIAQYQHALQLRPNYANAAYNLGLVYQSMRQPDRAITYYQQALRIEPNLFEALWNLGIAFCDTNQAGKAVEPFRRALALHPNDSESRVNAASILEVHGSDRGAASLLENATPSSSPLLPLRQR